MTMMGALMTQVYVVQFFFFVLVRRDAYAWSSNQVSSTTFCRTPYRQDDSSSFNTRCISSVQRVSSASFVSNKRGGRMLLLATNPGGAHSFVEGESYEDQMSEVMSMGGDPFFLTNDDMNDDDETDATGDIRNAKKEQQMTDIESMGGDSFFLTTDKEQDDTKEKDGSITTNDPPKTSLSASNVFASIGGGGTLGSVSPPPPPPPPPLSTSKRGYNGEMAEIDSMGGDSFFLTGDDVDDDNNVEDIDSMGGDSFFITKDTKQEPSRESKKEGGPPDNSSSGSDSTSSPFSAANIFASIGGGMEQIPAIPAEDSNSGSPVAPTPEYYDKEMAELDAMGGDPFFLTGDDDDDDKQQKKSLKEADISSSSDASSEQAPSPITAARIFGSLGGGVEIPSPPTATTQVSRSRSSPIPEELAEVEAMGGDPFFLTGDLDGEENTAEEVNAMGGDSSFLTNDNDDTDEKNDEERRYPTDGKGPRPSQGYNASSQQPQKDAKWEWDGVVDENAHMDFL